MVFKTFVGRCIMTVSLSRWMALNSGKCLLRGAARLSRAGMIRYMLMQANIAATAPWADLILSSFLASTTCPGRVNRPRVEDVRYR